MKPWTSWQDWTSVVLGAWIFFTPWIFQYDFGAPGWNAWIFGAAICVVGIWGLAQPSRGAEVVNAVLGAWLFISPWVLGFALILEAASWDAWIVGAIVTIVALSSIARMGTLHHEPPRHA